MRRPTLDEISALDAVSRLGGVTDAARALNLTHSAVSRRLRNIAQTLGYDVLEPRGQGVRLTPRARHYLDQVGPALELIARASAGQEPIEGVLRVNCAPGFAANWLSWRLDQFCDRFPGVALNITTATGYGALGALEDDVYITFMGPDIAPTGAEILRNAHFFPVVAPRLAAAPLMPADLAGFRLLHVGDREDWHRLFKVAGLAPAPDAGIVFGDIQTMIAAAEAGLGVALGDNLTAGRALAAGNLVRATSIFIDSPRAYYLLPGRAGATPAARVFCDWLREELASDPTAFTGEPLA